MSNKNSDGKKFKPSKWTLFCVGVSLFIAGFSVGFLSILTESSIDNTIIPLILLIIASILLIGNRHPKREDCLKSENHHWGLRFCVRGTSIFLIILCIAIIAGTLFAKIIYPFWKELELKNDLSSLIVPKNPKRFSFIVFGDTRTELYLPWQNNQKVKIINQIKRRYKDVKDSDIEMIFDDKTKILKNLKITSESLELEYSEGWPEIIKQNGVKIYDIKGYKSIYKRISELINPKEVQSDTEFVDFAIHTGDIVLWSDESNNEYWQEFNNRFYKTLTKYGHSKRILPVIGNHEYWYDNNASNYFDIFSHLKQSQHNEGLHYYALKYGKSFFIFLCSGSICNGSSYNCWNCAQAGFNEQIRWLKKVLDQAKKEKTMHIFVTYHKPSFSHSKHDPLIERHNPKNFLKEFKKNNKSISVTVFNGHNHTTEIYKVDDINYFVIGGGGAPQCLKSIHDYQGQPEELYWRGKAKRKELYNFLRVDVNGMKVKFKLFNYDLQSRKFIEEILPSEIQIDDSQAM